MDRRHCKGEAVSRRTLGRWEWAETVGRVIWDGAALVFV